MKTKNIIKNFGIWGFLTLSILLPIFIVELSKSYIVREEIALSEFYLLIFIILLGPLSGISITIYEIYKCFKERSSFKKGLFQIILAYFTIIFTFASIYYFQIFLGDYTDAISKYYSYNYLTIEGNEERETYYIVTNEKLPNLRAFSNFRKRFFTGVDYMPMENVYLIYEEPFTEKIINNSKIEDIDSIITFIPQNRILLYFDSLYYSIITLSTVGFGDVAPMQWYSKLAVSLQVIIGQFFLVLTIGFFFSTLNLDKDKK